MGHTTVRAPRPKNARRYANYGLGAVGTRFSALTVGTAPAAAGADDANSPEADSPGAGADAGAAQGPAAAAAAAAVDGGAEGAGAPEEGGERYTPPEWVLAGAAGGDGSPLGVDAGRR